MNNYFTNLISLISNLKGGTDLSAYVQADQDSAAKINYITIYNPELVDDKEESNEQLQNQVLCFLTPQAQGVLEANDTILQEHLNIIGLLRGINSLAHAFNESHNDETSIIKSSNSTTITKVLQDKYYLACSVSIPSHIEGKADSIINQLLKILEKANRYFFMLNSSFSKLSRFLDLKDMKVILLTYWQEFLDAYNSEIFKFPPDLKWTNSLNYGGFLGMITDPNGSFNDPTFKKSSINLSYAAINEIKETLHRKIHLERLEATPKGFLISYFDKQLPKKYGLVHGDNFDDEYSEEYSESIIDRASLSDIYTWLEYHDYHDNLDSNKLTTNRSSGKFFSSSDSIKKKISTPITTSSSNTPSNQSDYGLKISPTAALELLNPISLTNNLVILPLNYTMNSVINLGGNVMRTEQPTNSQLQQPPQDSNRNSWLSVSSYLNPFSYSSAQNNEDESQAPDTISELSESENDHGEYLIGLKSDESGNKFIFTRPVYLSTKVFKEDKIIVEEREYLLVVYSKDNIYVTLIYDSSYDGLHEYDFYKTLKEMILNPITDTITNFLLGGSILGNSIGSFNTMFNQKEFPEPDNDFFYVIYNNKDYSIQSSLPFLPIPAIFEQQENDNEQQEQQQQPQEEEKDQQINKVVLRYQNAIFHLHDQLIDLFITRNNGEFFNDESSIGEYLHKFNSNKTNDWMFYYIKYPNRFIIIIKNRHHSSKKKNQKKVNSVSLEENEGNFLNNIAGNVNLGFLDNLGDDVKLWLDSFKLT